MLHNTIGAFSPKGFTEKKLNSKAIYIAFLVICLESNESCP